MESNKDKGFLYPSNAVSGESDYGFTEFCFTVFKDCKVILKVNGKSVTIDFSEGNAW